MDKVTARINECASRDSGHGDGDDTVSCVQWERGECWTKLVCVQYGRSMNM